MDVVGERDTAARERQRCAGAKREIAVAQRATIADHERAGVDRGATVVKISAGERQRAGAVFDQAPRSKIALAAVAGLIDDRVRNGLALRRARLERERAVPLQKETRASGRTGPRIAAVGAAGYRVAVDCERTGERETPAALHENGAAKSGAAAAADTGTAAIAATKD